ncbi:MAG: ribosome maturation factor RimM [Bacteroidota bacterium]
MMDEKKFFCLGKILKPFGYKGQFVAIFEVNHPEKYKKLEFVFVEIQHEQIPFFVAEFEMQKNDTAIIKLDYIDTVDAVRKIVGSALLIPESDLEKLEADDESSTNALEGYTVIDKQHGNIGTIHKVLELPQQLIMQIFFNSKEILIPLNADFISKIDKKKKILTIIAPEGLIDFYLA